MKVLACHTEDPGLIPHVGTMCGAHFLYPLHDIVGILPKKGTNLIIINNAYLYVCLIHLDRHAQGAITLLP